MKSLRWLSVLTWISLGLSSTAFAQLLVPGDQQYFTKLYNRTLYIVPQSYKHLGPPLIPYAEFFHREYEKSFNWTLDEITAYVLASPNNQIANGVTFANPNEETVFYPSGMAIQDQFAIKSWLYVLMPHEMSHLYQLNAKTSTPSLLKSVLGNPPLSFIFPVPLFLQPNLFLPTYTLEGNAVFNESRFGQGGRLYSGEVRALVYSLIREHKVNMKRLMNDHIDFPFTTEKYDVGGYFAEYLAERFGVDRVNSFYVNNGIHWINPLLLDRTYRTTFGEGYEQLLKEFLREYEPKAQKQVIAPGAPIASAYYLGAMNHDDKAVFFVEQTDGRSVPRLIRIDKATGQISKEKQDLEIGKLFYLNPKIPVTAASVQDTVETIRYSLYGTDHKLFPQFNSKVIQDMRSGHTLYLDPVQSFVQTRLLRDGHFIDYTASTAVLDDNGSAYYFKQLGLDRALFKDKIEIARFTGFYGKPIEALKDGSVIFIAATESGSSLFSAKNGVVSRIAKSDAIVDAQILNSHQAVIAEASGSNYQVKIAEIDLKPERPGEYHYVFEADPEFKFFQDDIPTKPPPNKEDYAIRHPYLEPFQLRYSSTTIETFFDNTGPIGSISEDFEDPLQQNAFDATYLRNLYRTNAALVSYTNTRHRFSYSLGWLYKEDVLLGTNNTVVDHHYDNTGYFDLNFPVFVWRHWTGNLSFETAYDHIDSYHFPGYYPIPERRNIGFFGSAQLNYLESYPLSYAPYQSLSVVVADQLVADGDTWTKTDNPIAAHIQGSLDALDETFLSGGGGTAFATNHDIIVDDAYSLHATPFTFTTLVPGFAARALEVKEANLGLQQVINQSLYFYKFPISLRRYAPFVRGQYFWLRDRINFNPPDLHFWLYQAGSEFELLIAHKFPVKVSVSYLASTLTRTTNGLAFGLSTQFTY
jgi:hypothetical protein